MGYHGVILGIVLAAGMCDGNTSLGRVEIDEDSGKLIIITPEDGGAGSVDGEQGTLDFDVEPGSVTQDTLVNVAFQPLTGGGLDDVSVVKFSVSLDPSATLLKPMDVTFRSSATPNRADGSTTADLLFPAVVKTPSPGDPVPIAYPNLMVIDRPKNTVTVDLKVSSAGTFNILRANRLMTFRAFPDVVKSPGVTHKQQVCVHTVDGLLPTTQRNLAAGTLEAVGELSVEGGESWEFDSPAIPLAFKQPVEPVCADVEPRFVFTEDLEDGSEDLAYKIVWDNYTLTKSDPAGDCVLRGIGGEVRFVVSEGPGDAGPGDGGDGPHTGFVTSLPADNPDLSALVYFPEPIDAPILASVATNPAILVGGKILHTFEPPPGVPPPPPPGPQPELVQAILAFDLEGNEIARLPLGDLGDAGLSCQLLSYDGASGRVDHFFIYGQVNFSSTVWNPDIPDFGAVSTSPNVKNVTDFSLYNGDQFSGGGVAAWFQGQSLFFFEYNPAFGLFTQTETIDSSQFQGASGGPTSGYRWQAGGQTLFVTDGQPGELWSHPGTGTLAQTSTNATKIGNVGNGPRQIRFLGEIGVVSNFDSGTLTVVRRQSNGTVTILGTVTVGSGPIGLDLRLNSAGNIEVLSTGFNDHTYTLTVLSPAGAVIGTPKTRTVPEGGLNPVHAIFVNAQGTRISITCNGSDEMLIFDLPAS